MATTYKRGAIWWGRFTHRGKEYRKSLETASRHVAKRRIEKWRREITDTAWGDQPARLYDTAMRDFLVEHGAMLRPQSYRRYKTSAKALLPHFEGKKLHQITRAGLKEFETARRKEGVSPPTIRRDLACLSSMFSFEIEHERIDTNPVPAYLKARKRRGLREAPPRTRYLSHDEEAALLAESPDYLRELIAFAIDTGLRLEEQLSLTWPQVHLGRHEVTVIGKGGKKRTVPLQDRAGTILGTVPRHIRTPGEPDWIFCKRKGTAIGQRYHKLTRGLAGGADRAKIGDLRWHDLRRTCGCRLLQDKGLAMEQVRDWLGHESVVQTERSYAFLSIDSLHESIRHGTNLGTGHADSQQG